MPPRTPSPWCTNKMGDVIHRTTCTHASGYAWPWGEDANLIIPETELAYHLVAGQRPCGHCLAGPARLHEHLTRVLERVSRAHAPVPAVTNPALATKELAGLSAKVLLAPHVTREALTDLTARFVVLLEALS